MRIGKEAVTKSHIIGLGNCLFFVLANETSYSYFADFVLL